MTASLAVNNMQLRNHEAAPNLTSPMPWVQHFPQGQPSSDFHLYTALLCVHAQKSQMTEQSVNGGAHTASPFYRSWSWLAHGAGGALYLSPNTQQLQLRAAQPVGAGRSTERSCSRHRCLLPGPCQSFKCSSEHLGSKKSSCWQHF